MKIDELAMKGIEWLNIFKNEHIYDDNLIGYSLENRLEYFTQQEIINYNKETKEINLIEIGG